MRRIYYTTPKKKQLAQEALLNMRKLRRTLDPDVLDHARGIIEAHQAHTPPQTDEGVPQIVDGKVSVDRRKNLSIIMKFLETQPDQALSMRVRTLLNEALH